jgi:hypothetical protein
VKGPPADVIVVPGTACAGSIQYLYSYIILVQKRSYIWTRFVITKGLDSVEISFLFLTFLIDNVKNNKV